MIDTNILSDGNVITREIAFIRWVTVAPTLGDTALVGGVTAGVGFDPVVASFVAKVGGAGTVFIDEALLGIRLIGLNVILASGIIYIYLRETPR